ncbi:MAG: 50S ribosomal protein L31 [Patescibacteria group bacterium]|nr:50S ribosomal protein L31 [Patescibacteria group bacterium]
MAKKDTHPEYYRTAKIKCACNNTLTIGSTREKIEVEICAKCHPFFTGEEKLIDTAGRVEKFKNRRAKVQPVKPKKVRAKKK